MISWLKRLLSSRRRPSEFRPENRLETAMLQTYRGDQGLAEFYRALWYADVLIPQLRPTPDEDAPPEAPEFLEVPVLVVDGRRYIPVFSSLTQLRRFVPDGSTYVELPCQLLTDDWSQEDWMLLNPKGQLGRELSPAEVRSLPDGPGPSVVDLPDDASVHLSEPTKEPTPLLQAVAAYCRQCPAVRAAYRAEMFIDMPGEEPHVAIGLQVAENANPDAIVREVHEIVQQAWPNGAYLCHFLDADDGNLAAFMLQKTAPFYTRP